MLSFRDRYMAGEYERVWDELCALGPQVRGEPYYEDALAVAQETMQRVRRNSEILIPRLEHLGWQFGYAWASPWASKLAQAEPPRLGQPTPAARLNAIEARNGPLPIALRTFYEVVGAINLVGAPFHRAHWPTTEDQFDPLYIAGVEQAFGPDDLPTWRPGNAVFIAPDALNKYFIAGVGAHFIQIPSADADAPLMFEDGPIYIADREVTLVRYLRYALRGGGFLAFLPGWEPDRMPEEDLAYLREGLEPI